MPFWFKLIALAQRMYPPFSLCLKQMDTSLNARLTVETVLKKWPQSISIFLSAGTKCPGCFMEQFCTLEDVAGIYGLRVEELMRDLAECVQSEDQAQRSTQ